MIESILYKTAIYCRLSLDDGSLGESGSIQTQKNICYYQKFIDKFDNLLYYYKRQRFANCSPGKTNNY